MTSKPTVVELFAGAGGAALGLSAAGFEHLACIEWDGDACETLRAAGLPCVEGDVRDLGLYEPEWVGCGLLWSSFPCQCWSTAGKRLGPGDERNGWPWTVDAIDRTKPEWFAAENVTGLLQHKGECAGGCLGPEDCPRAYFDLVILSQLRERFPVVQQFVLNASSFGVPQHRRRVVVIAGPASVRRPEPTHGKPTHQADLFGRRMLPWATVGEALGISGYVRTEMTGAVAHSVGGPSGTVPNGGNQYLHANDPGVRLDVGLLDHPAPTVTATEVKGSRGVAHIAGRHSGLERASDALFLATGRRRLTIEECAILQDFPEDHPFQGTKGSRYKQVGNAVPPKLAEVVGRAVLDAMS